LYAGARSAIHRTLRVSPGGLVLHRDMLLNIPLLADFQLVNDRRQVAIEENLRRANSKRRHHGDYQPGDESLLIHFDPTKLEPRKYGPCTIEHVHILMVLSPFVVIPIRLNT
jgi:hypothetical protein